MSAIAARKAALLLQQAAHALPVQVAPEAKIETAPQVIPQASSSRKTYSKKDIAGKGVRGQKGKNLKRPESSRSIRRSSPVQTPIKGPGEPESQPEDRVFVEIDIVEDQSAPETNEEPEQQLQRHQDTLTEASRAPSADASDGGDFAFDFAESGILSGNGRPRKKRRVDGDEVMPISSFVPAEGVNVYGISADAIERILPNLPKRRGVLIIMNTDETIVLSGAARIAPIQGSLSVFSSTISPSTTPASYPVYAPLTHPLPTLSSAGPAPDTLLPRILRLLSPSPPAIDPAATVFFIQDLSTGLSDMPGAAAGLHKVFPEGRGAFGLPGVHPIFHSSLSPIYRYITPPSWHEALERIGQPPRDQGDELEDVEVSEDPAAPFVMIVKGAKRSGKSTFAREAANRLLQKYERVAYLDTDLGQSEFGVGGSVGLYLLDQPLFGPAFTHPLAPLRSHFIGALNPRLSSEHYLAAVGQLVDQYRFEVQYPINATESSRISEVVPLVINTQGWVKGLGADLLLEIERLAEPFHTFTFAESSAAEVDGEQSFQGEDFTIEESDMHLRSGFGVVCPLQPIPVTPLLSRFTASDMRTLSTISYLHSRAADSEHTFWDFSEPLACHAPWQVSTDTVFKEIYITGEGSDGIIEEDLVLALNNRLVGLVERTDGTSDGFYTPGRSLPSPVETHCLGIGLIRSISPDGKTVHLLTPLPAAALSRVSIMIAGELELPVCGMLDWRLPAHAASRPTSLFGVLWEDVPFLVEGKDQGVGMAKRKFRRNIMRRSQA